MVRRDICHGAVFVIGSNRGVIRVRFLTPLHWEVSVSQQWIRPTSPSLLFRPRPPALVIDEEGLAVFDPKGASPRRARWTAIQGLATRRQGAGRNAHWFLDVAVSEGTGLDFSVEVTGLNAPWPRVLHACRTAWSAARAKPNRAPRTVFVWPEARPLLRRG